ncbi:MAG: hypothetical protein IID33_15655, partial [Planctomycetes bacterium]|nr:hypothetical protein [Planctomycetota bacterium]
MAMVTPPPPGGRVTPSALGPFVRGVPKVLVLIAIIPLMALGGVCYWWFVQRVEVGSEKVLVLVRKVGKPLPDEFANQVVLYPALLSELEEASDSWAYKGIIYAPLREGRHFFDPFFWERRIFDAEIVKAGEVGIKIRKYGRPL